MQAQDGGKSVEPVSTSSKTEAEVRRRRRWRKLVVAFWVLAAIAWGAGVYFDRRTAPENGAAGASSPSAPSVAEGVKPGQRAPDFTLTTTNGEAFRLSSFRGGVVVVDFLAPGCPSCAVELAALTEVWGKVREEGVTVLVVDVGGGPIEEAVRYFRSVGGGDYLYAADPGFRVATSYEVLALGTTVIVDDEGIVRYVDSEPTSADVMSREVRGALS